MSTGRDTAGRDGCRVQEGGGEFDGGAEDEGGGKKQWSEASKTVLGFPEGGVSCGVASWSWWCQDYKSTTNCWGLRTDNII